MKTGVDRWAYYQALIQSIDLQLLLEISHIDKQVNDCALPHIIYPAVNRRIVALSPLKFLT